MATAISKAEAPEHGKEPDPLEEAERARGAAGQALEARVRLEEEAERARLRADDALTAQVAAEEEAERTGVIAQEAQEASLAAEEEAKRARLAAEEALYVWATTLQVGEPERYPLAPAERFPLLEPIPETELHAAGIAVEGTFDVGETDSAEDANQPEPEEPTPSLPASAALDLTCQIAHWRGYFMSRFYARTFGRDGSEFALSESPLFRARSTGLPERTDEAVAAFEALITKLENDGWELAGRDDTWFGRTFRRRVTAAAEQSPE